LLFLKNGALSSSGWLLSARKGSSVDKNGEPLPWLTYPLIHFLEPRLTRQLDVFEYGSGNSTLWFARRVATISSVEYDARWYAKIRGQLPGNAGIRFIDVRDKDTYGQMAFRKLPDSDPNMAYVHAIRNKRKDQKTDPCYDLIIVDGLFRPDCIAVGIHHLKAGGVLLIDNTNHADIQPFLEGLKNTGFKCIDFWGMCPIEPIISCSSIYYQENNWLNI
ncbi:MAG TPA: hypothetical protein VIH22_01220, partial [Cyclobacteriaceae bacterium]